MIRIATSLRATGSVFVLACALAAAGCVPTLPRFSSPDPSVEPEAPQVSPAAGGSEADPTSETMQVTAAPPPEVQVDVIVAPPGTKAGPVTTGSMAAAPAEPSGADVVVPAGKTLYAIAREHDVAVRDLIELNRLDPPYSLLAGQKLKLPTERTYLVQRGDTLYSVARRTGVDIHALVQRNKLPPPYNVVLGTRLKLPAPSEPLIGPVDEKPAAVANAVITPVSPKPETKPAVAPPPAEAPEPAVVARAPVEEERAERHSARVIKPPPRAGASFFWPVRGRVVSQFGRQDGGVQHDGITIAVPRGTPVRASENGIVAYAGSDLKAYGNLLLIRHADGWMTAYANNEELLVHEGDVVRRGQVVAHAGASGTVHDPQTYFEIRYQGKPVDPLSHLAKS